MSDSVSWAAAGRNAEKVDKTMKDLGISQGVSIQADSYDLDSMTTLAKQAKVVINATGPAMKMGENVVRACIMSKTDYCDITGEVEWVDGMKRRYHNEAVNAGVRVVSCTGLDSIPADLLVFLGNQAFENGGHGKIGQADIVFKLGGGGIPHGTMETMLNMRDRIAKGQTRFVPSGGQGTDETGQPLVSKEATKALRKSQAAFWPVSWVDDKQLYMPMHIMKSVDERVVYASAGELGYHDNLLINETMHVPNRLSYFKGTLFSSAVMGTLGTVLGLAKFGWAKSWLRGLIKEPSQSGLTHCVLTATNARKDAYARAHIIAPELDAGMGFTSLVCLESALCLLNKDKTPLPGPPGFHTPAVAFGNVLADRLAKHPEIKIAVACGKTKEDVKHLE